MQRSLYLTQIFVLQAQNKKIVIKCYVSGLCALVLFFYLTRIGFCVYSRCRVTTTMGPLRRRAESTTERRTDTQTFYHVSEDLYSAADNINVTFRLEVLLITKSKGRVIRAEMKNKSQLFMKRLLMFFLSLLSSTDDHSRVVLSHLDGHLCSDYINASYIDVSLN